jgi:hypothetical protein
MTVFAVDEERIGELADRLKDAREVLEPRSAAYQLINDDALERGDEGNPEPAPLGEEKCRVDEALELADKAEHQLNSARNPSEDLLDRVEQTVELIEAIIRDTPAEESAARSWDDEDGEYAWDQDDLTACTE